MSLNVVVAIEGRADSRLDFLALRRRDLLLSLSDL